MQIINLQKYNVALIPETTIETAKNNLKNYFLGGYSL